MRPFLVSLSFLLCSILPALAVGQTTDRESELEALRREISGLEERLGGLRARERGLVQEIEESEFALRLQEKRLEEARTARALGEQAVAENRARVAALEEAIEVRRQALKQRLAYLYRLGREGYLRLALSLGAEGDLLGGLRQLRYLAQRDARFLLEFLEATAALRSQRVALMEESRLVEAWIEQEALRRQRLVVLRRSQAGVLRRLEAESRQLAGRAEALGEKERKLSSLLDLLYGRSETALEGTPIQQFEGVLDWPVSGRVTRRFGPQIDARYKTSVPHNGIDIATPDGGSVNAVYPGAVMFAAPFSGYGLTAILHHPGRVFTLYAGLRELKVERGDVLSLGQVIGAAGQTLYFEIRVENLPVDPSGWLR